MYINLSKEALYEQNIFDAARNHSSKTSMQTKRSLDREATFFKQYVRSLNKKIDNSLDNNKDLYFVIEGNEVNRLVMIFNGSHFDSVDKLNKMVRKKATKIAGLLSDKKKINFNAVGTTVNLDFSKDLTENRFVSCLEFITDVKLKSFCLVG